MPRGGRRYGTPGATYNNRVDLNTNRGPVPMQAAKGQQYGMAKQQMDAQRAIPVAPPPPPALAGPARPAGPPAPAAGPSGPLPGQVVPLSAPTLRPDEPVTAGLAVGAGPGAEANPFSQVGSPDDAITALRAAYSVYPSEELRAILERIDLADD